MSKKKDAEREPDAVVFDYMVEQNRPYSAIDVFNNLHKELNKTVVTKALESLAAEGKLLEKVYNKQKVYCVRQSLLPAANADEIALMDRQLDEISEQLRREEAALRQLDDEVKTLKGAASTSEVLQQIADVERELRTKEERLAAARRTDVAPIDPALKANLTAQWKKYVTMWKQRKRSAKDMIDAILEGYPNSKAQLLEEIGVETDESVNVVLPSL